MRKCHGSRHCAKITALKNKSNQIVLSIEISNAFKNAFFLYIFFVVSANVGNKIKTKTAIRINIKSIVCYQCTGWAKHMNVGKYFVWHAKYPGVSIWSAHENTVTKCDYIYIYEHWELFSSLLLDNLQWSVKETETHRIYI